MDDTQTRLAEQFVTEMMQREIEQTAGRFSGLGIRDLEDIASLPVRRSRREPADPKRREIIRTAHDLYWDRVRDS